MANSANVSVGKPLAAGGIFSAPLTADTPEDATAPLTGFVDLGYVSDSGLVNSISSDTTDINAWGGDRVLTVRTSRSESFQWTFIETNADVLKEVYGDGNVTIDDGDIAVLHNSKDLPRRQYVFEIALTGDRVKRIVVPNGQVTEVGDVTYVDGDPIGYEVTVSAYPDEDGNTAYEYIASVA
jgi:hypothetical protein